MELMDILNRQQYEALSFHRKFHHDVIYLVGHVARLLWICSIVANSSLNHSFFVLCHRITY